MGGLEKAAAYHHLSMSVSCHVKYVLFPAMSVSCEQSVYTVGIHGYLLFRMLTAISTNIVFLVDEWS